MNTITHSIPILVITLLLASCSTPYYNTDPLKHKEYVDASRMNQSTLVSLDTAFRNGVPYALYKEYLWSGNNIVFTATALHGSDNIEVRSSLAGHLQYIFQNKNSKDTACFTQSTMYPYTLNAIVDANLFNPNGFNLKNTDAFLRQYSCAKIVIPEPPVQQIAPGTKSSDDFCIEFNNDDLQGSTVENISTRFSESITKGKNNTFLQCSDESGISYLCLPIQFLGDWTAKSNCTRTLCFDAQIINDGMPDKHHQYSIGLRVEGAGYTAAFTSPTELMSEPTGNYGGWHHVCALLSSSTIPASWVMTGGAPPTAWATMIKSITKITIGYDATSEQTEVFGLDNICIQNSCNQKQP